MSYPVAWINENLDTHVRATYYIHPSELGDDIPESDLIPMYEGWEDRLQEFEDSLEPGWVPIVVEDGKYDKYYVGVPVDKEDLPEDEPDISAIANAVRDSINSL